MDFSPLKYGLHHSFIDKSHFVRRDLAVEMETLAETIDKLVPQDQKESFHEYLRKETNRLSQNVFHTNDSTFKKTKQLRNMENLTFLSGDKDSSVTILNKIDYSDKVQKMIDDGIQQGKYIKCSDNILKELQSFQSFLYRHFKDRPEYESMKPSSHQPARFFATSKTHKFDKIEDIELNKLTLRPIIDQTGTCYYKAGKVIAAYLQPLTKN